MDEYETIDVVVMDEDLIDHLDPDHPFEIDLGGQGYKARRYKARRYKARQY